jgi:hypothetical protein
VAGVVQDGLAVQRRGIDGHRGGPGVRHSNTVVYNSEAICRKVSANAEERVIRLRTLSWGSPLLLCVFIQLTALWASEELGDMVRPAAF